MPNDNPNLKTSIPFVLFISSLLPSTILPYLLEGLLFVIQIILSQISASLKHIMDANAPAVDEKIKTSYIH